MGAGAVDPVRAVAVLAGYLALVVAGSRLCRRVVTWARTGPGWRERRAASAVLALLLVHGLTLALGGLALVLVLLGFRGAIPATERDGFVRAARVCFAVGPVLAAVAWAGLRRARRAAARAEGRNGCA